MNKAKVFLDAKGLVMHSFFRCKDKDSTLFGAKGERVTRAPAAFETFLTSYILPIFEDHAPKDVIAVWDSGNEKRIDLLASYKEKRRNKEKDQVVEEQLDLTYKMIKDFLAGMGCIQVSVPKTEADDVIAYLCRNVTPYCEIYTMDQDLIQLHDPKQCMVFVKQEIRDTMSVKEPKATSQPIPSNLVALYKSIVGDSSDEYPGVVGMGDAAWERLVKEFGMDGMEELDELARNKDLVQLKEIAEDVADKDLNKILAQQYHWLLMYELAKLHPEWCEGNYRKKLIKPQWFKRIPNRERVMNILSKSHCIDLLENLDPFLPVTILVTEDNVDDVIYGNFMDDLNASVVSMDYEGYDKNNYEQFKEVSKGKYVDSLSSEITGASFTWGANLNKTVYISTGHKDTNNTDNDVIGDVIKESKDIVVHNRSYEGILTALTFGKDFADEYLAYPKDTQIMSVYVDENERKGLKDNTERWLRYHQTSYKEVVGDRAGMHELTAEETLDYGADDAIVTAHLWSLFDFICMVEGTREFIYDHEFHTTKVFDDAFLKGCRVSQDRLSKLEATDKARLDILWPEMREILSKNCTETNDEATATYMEDIKDFIIAKMLNDKNSEEAIQKKLEAMTAEFREATKYRPFVKEVVSYQFKPTVAQLNAALVKLGIEDLSKASNEEDYEDPHAQYFLGSVALSRITDWAMVMFNARQEGDPLVTDEVVSFVDLVSSSAHQFKKREGPEYEQLSQFMVDLFPEKSKTVTSGDELNFDSSKQMAQLLFGKLALPIRNRTKVDPGSIRDRLGFSGGPSANDKAVEMALAEDVYGEDSWRKEVLDRLRDIKGIETRYKLYYRPYPLWIRPDDGRMHTSIINCGTKTRRPSGTSPNILQVSKGLIRSVYLPLEEGHVLVAPDFSGQELRILGSESMDPVIIDAYMGEERKDIHSLTASAIFPKIAANARPDLMDKIEYVSGKGSAQDYNQFMLWRTDEELGEFSNWVRNKRAKGVNFLVNYEGGAGTLSTSLLVPQEEAQGFIDGMFALYTQIPVFQENAHKEAEKYGYTITAYGNRRHMTEDILSRDNGLKMRMQRQGSNAKIQGCAADILKVVVAECEKSGLLRRTKSYIMAPVYDEVVCSVPIGNVVPFCQELQKIMDVTPPGHIVPMVSEFSVGFDWYNMVEIGVDTSAERIMEAIEEAVEMQVEYDGGACLPAGMVPKSLLIGDADQTEPVEEFLIDESIVELEDGFFEAHDRHGKSLGKFLYRGAAAEAIVFSLKKENAQ